MNKEKRAEKELAMIKAAESVFGEYGFKNTKMEDIAAAANITKVTLYSYFQSKENIYLAVAHQALNKLNDELYLCVNRNMSKNGISSIMDFIDTFITYCEENPFASQLYLDYFSIQRSANSNTPIQLTESIRESFYYMKLKDIENIGFKLAGSEIKKGQEDGSIRPELDPMLSTLLGWTTILGYIKVLSASGQSEKPVFGVKIGDLKSQSLEMMRTFLSK